ncbi:hypothetical protein [Halorubrum sp. DTA46]|uniref:hypothetical protein n=1 Tax=Halorubrum sp. DTA46 TaxID=3402162 RepID=UPI003AAEC1FA
MTLHVRFGTRQRPTRTGPPSERLVVPTEALSPDGPPMTDEHTWAFRTASGSVRVAPSELRVHYGVVGTFTGSAAALAAGRFPPVVRRAGWPATAALMALITVAMEWSWNDGATVGLFLGLFGLVTVLGTGVVSAVRRRIDGIPLRDVEHATFEDGTVVVTYRDESDGDTKSLTLRPRDGTARADAALALRLRGVELRGAADDEAVSRTVVDAPETELVR